MPLEAECFQHQPCDERPSRTSAPPPASPRAQPFEVCVLDTSWTSRAPSGKTTGAVSGMWKVATAQSLTTEPEPQPGPHWTVTNLCAVS